MWNLDANDGLLEVPDLLWLQYYRGDRGRLTEIPITNWWRVSHLGSNGERELKLGAVVKSTVFFELLSWACIQHGATQDVFIGTLQNKLMETCKSLKASELTEMAAGWVSARMVIVEKPMHANFVQLYVQMHASIIDFLKGGVWQSTTGVECVATASDILQTLKECVNGKVTVPREPNASGRKIHPAPKPQARSNIVVDTSSAPTTANGGNGTTESYLALIHRTLERILERLT